MHEMHSNFSMSCMACQKKAKIKLSQTRQTKPKMILKQNILAWHFSKINLAQKIMATKINPIGFINTRFF